MVETGIIPECYVDTNLTETLTGIVCNHQKGCSNVVKQMEEKRSDRFALGVIDKDKRKVTYVSEFVLVAGNDWLEVLKHKSRHHYLIYIIPAVEGFILRAASEMNVSLADYGLPVNLTDLTKVTKQQDSKNDARFKKLFNAIKDSTGLQVLKNAVDYLRVNQYDVDLEELKRIVL